jgi:release factor glutamine methyltransferase
VEEAVKKFRGYKLHAEGRTSDFRLQASSFRILDLCTGSGCIALAVAKEFPDAEVYGTEISGSALRYANENASINKINNLVFLRGSLFEPIQELSASGGLRLAFDLITANPPYIRRSEIEHLQPEVREWEPMEALDGGEDGIDYYRLIIPGAAEYLKEEGCLICELGIGQSEAVSRIALVAGFKKISLREDYAGIKRILVAEKE